MPFRFYAILGAIGAAVLLLLASHTFAYRSGAANVKAEWKESVAKANHESFRITELRQARVDAAAKTASSRRVVISRDAIDNADRIVRLQRAVAARNLAEESAEAATKRANTAEELLFTSSRLLTRIGKEADGHVADKQLLLEAWPD